MSCRGMAFVLLAPLLGGCSPYWLVPAGTSTVGNLQLAPAAAWNEAPPTSLPYARKGSAVWTRDGLSLNRFVVIPAVPDGEALFEDRGRDAALPAFRSAMLPNELEQLIESSIVKLMGEGNSAVITSNLRSHRYGADPGILLDIDASVTDGPEYRGLAGAFVSGGSLYFMLYLAATPYYFDKDRAEAESLITSALAGEP